MWLFQLLNETAEHEKENKMTAKTLAQLFSPNLYSTEFLDSLQAMSITTKLYNLTTILIENKFSN